MRGYVEDIKNKTADMDKKEAVFYILTYYWYHLLGIILAIALILLFAGHYLFGSQKPVFTCVMVNQRIDGLRDQSMGESFAEMAGLPPERVNIDSNYNFSYGQTKLEGVNESSYEKFFFQWENKEIDAAVLPESFYLHCKSMGGRFRQLTAEERAGFTAYQDGGECTAVVLGDDRLTKEKLLLAFPSTGAHPKEGRKFLEYLRKELKEGGNFGQIVN